MFAESILIGDELTGPGKFGEFLKRLVFKKTWPDLALCLSEFEKECQDWRTVFFNPGPEVLTQLRHVVTGVFDCLSHAESGPGGTFSGLDQRSRDKLFRKATEVLLRLIDVYRETLKKTSADCRFVLVDRFSRKFDRAAAEFARSLRSDVERASPEMMDKRSCGDWVAFVSPSIEADDSRRSVPVLGDLGGDCNQGILTQMFYFSAQPTMPSGSPFLFPDTIVLLAPVNVAISTRQKIARGLHGFQKEFVITLTIVSAASVSVIEHFVGLQCLYVVPVVTVASVLFVFWAGRPSSIHDSAASGP